MSIRNGYYVVTYRGDLQIVSISDNSIYFHGTDETMSVDAFLMEENRILGKVEIENIKLKVV